MNDATNLHQIGNLFILNKSEERKGRGRRREGPRKGATGKRNGGLGSRVILLMLEEELKTEQHNTSSNEVAFIDG